MDGPGLELTALPSRKIFWLDRQDKEIKRQLMPSTRALYDSIKVSGRRGVA